MKTYPHLLSIEGIDGSGKSTQVSAVAKALSDKGIETQDVVVSAHGARTVNDLAEMITGDRFAYHPAIPADLREWTFACDIAYHCKTVFRPLLERGITLVQDRGPLSYRVSAERYGAFTSWVERVHALFPRPFRTYLVDVPIEVAERRLGARTEQPQQADESHDLLVEMRTRLLDAAEKSSSVVVIDGTADPDEVTAHIVADWLSLDR